MPEGPQHIDDEKRTLILTGASRGIGHATVKRFSSAGWRVITCSRHAFPENCPWAAGPEDHIQVDLSNAADTARAIAEMRERLPEWASCMPWSTMPRFRPSPKDEGDTGASRLNVLESPDGGCGARSSR